MRDLIEDKNSTKLESFATAGETFAVVCHSTGAPRHGQTPAGKRIVKGKTATSFTNGEEDEVELPSVVAFFAQDEVMRFGAAFSKVRDRGAHAIADGRLIAGQNPASSGPAAKLLFNTLKKKAK